jgi:UMF1 family MFS transporter
MSDPHLTGAGATERRQQRAWYFYDWANSAFSTTVVTVFLGPYLITLAEDAAGPDGRVGFLVWDVRPGSYFSLLVSLSVVLQVLVRPDINVNCWRRLLPLAPAPPC